MKPQALALLRLHSSQAIFLLACQAAASSHVLLCSSIPCTFSTPDRDIAIVNRAPRQPPWERRLASWNLFHGSLPQPRALTLQRIILNNVPPRILHCLLSLPLPITVAPTSHILHRRARFHASNAAPFQTRREAERPSTSQPCRGTANLTTSVAIQETLGPHYLVRSKHLLLNPFCEVHLLIVHSLLRTS